MPPCTFSPIPGAPEVKEDRARRAAEAAAELEREYLSQSVGRSVEVLFEEEREGLWWGHTTRYCKVGARSGENLHNRLRNVQITGAEDGWLLGEVLNLENG